MGEKKNKLRNDSRMKYSIENRCIFACGYINERKKTKSGYNYKIKTMIVDLNFLFRMLFNELKLIYNLKPLNLKAIRWTIITILQISYWLCAYVYVHFQINRLIIFWKIKSLWKKKWGYLWQILLRKTWIFLKDVGNTFKY